eukprot:12330814-Alexandrium_andersonii.AAC.1
MLASLAVAGVSWNIPSHDRRTAFVAALVGARVGQRRRGCCWPALVPDRAWPGTCLLYTSPSPRD